MKRLFLIAFTCASLVAPVGAAAPRGLSESGSVALIARLAPGVDAVAEAALHRTAGAEVTRRTDALGLIALEVDRQDVWRYRESPLIRWVERDRVRPVTEAPNDPHLRNQWPFDKLRLQKAWGREPGTSNPVTVAVVDTGVDFEHPDLDGRLVSGFDFVNNDELPADDHGHGTHVSGVIAANPDNRVGIAGMSWGAKIMPLKACSAKGRCPDSTVASAIAYAAVSGADIVNLSLGGPSPACPRAFELAARLAEARGVLLVASSANDAQSGN
ncbi:MAG: S8 family serine peptidase, partial [Actinomycetota bacterium]